MDYGVLIVCFDINSKKEENQVSQDDNSENLMENPNRIFNSYFSNHKKITNIEKQQINSSEYNIKFTLDLPEQSLFQITIINDLSFIHNISLNANSYIIFMNLEDPKAKEKLENLIAYMLESCCSVDVKTYVIGMYKDNSLKKYNKENIESVLSDNYLNCEYYEIQYNEDTNHFCINEYIQNKNYSDPKSFVHKNKEFKVMEILEKILIESYETKMEVKFNPNKRKFVSFLNNNKGEGDAMSGKECTIL